MITIKEEFLGSPKWKRAIELGGSDAIVMWLALKCYAASNPTDGFVADGDIVVLPGAPRNPRKALKALVECGRTNRDGSRAAGLVDPVEHGWQLHDYHDHAPSSAEVQERKRKARERKERWQARNANGTRPDTNPERAENDSGTRSGTDPQPNPTQPIRSEEEDNARARVPCPPDLELTDGQRGSLITSGIPEPSIDETTKLFRAKYQDGAEPRTLEQWRRGLVTACSKASNDRRIPKPGGRANDFDVDAWAEAERKKAGGS